MKECPCCFHELKDEEDVCPNCGQEYGKPLPGQSPREKHEKKYKTITRVAQVICGIIAIAAALLGYYFGNWGWAALGFGLGVIATFLTMLVVGVLEHMAAEQLPPDTDSVEEESDGSDSGDSGTDQGA